MLNWKFTYNYSQGYKLHEGKYFYFLFTPLPKCLKTVTGTQYHAMYMCWMKDWLELISCLLCEGPWQMPTSASHKKVPPKLNWIPRIMLECKSMKILRLAKVFETNTCFFPNRSINLVVIQTLPLLFIKIATTCWVT